MFIEKIPDGLLDVLKSKADRLGVTLGELVVMSLADALAWEMSTD